jgi:hypothetical protein
MRETIEEKLSFGESFQRRRCLIAADGFYSVAQVREIGLALLLSDERRIVIRVRRHLGRVARKWNLNKFLRHYHYHSERTLSTNS